MKNKILIIDCGSSKVPEIEKIISSFGVTYSTSKLLALYNIHDINGIIISGAPILLTETSVQPFLDRIEPIFKNNPIPVLGICFGHQLMGLIHNAKITKCEPDRNWQNIIFEPKFELFDCNSADFMEDHCECIDCPDDFIVSGSSSICSNEAMQHKVNPWYGVQFHPEVSGKNGNLLIKNFLKKCNVI